TREALRRPSLRPRAAADDGCDLGGLLHRPGAAQRSACGAMARAERLASATRLLWPLAGRRPDLLAFAAGLLPLRSEPHPGAMVLGRLGRAARERDLARRHRRPRLVHRRLAPLPAGVRIGGRRRARARLVPSL